MVTEISIRLFSERHAAQVRELFIVVNRLLSPPNLRNAFEAYIERALVEEIDRIAAHYSEHAGSFWVAVEDEKVVGMFGLERTSDGAMELRRMYSILRLADRASLGKCSDRQRANAAVRMSCVSRSAHRKSS
jgi:hypothetical protein